MPTSYLCVITTEMHFRMIFGAEYLANLSFLPAQPAGQLLHIKFTQMIDEGTLNRKSTSTNDG